MGLISINGYEPKHLSYSTIGTYRMCAKKFELEKVQQREQRPGIAALAGNAVHTASEVIDHLIWEGGFEALEGEASPALDSSDTTPTTDEFGDPPF
jgi:hypothetical protein